MLRSFPHPFFSLTSFFCCAFLCFPLRQGAARASACETSRPRGHARRDGDDPHRHAGGGSDRPGAVEAETPSVLQREAFIYT